MYRHGVFVPGHLRQRGPRRTERETRSWRRTGSSGQWLEQTFCTICGSVVFMRAEGLGDALSVSVGCLEDPHFPAPATLHWPDRKHKWLCLEGLPKVA
ncbi:GFA family protein [Mesorhizobium sp. M1423]